MPNDIPDWTQAADIQAGSVNITAGTVDVQNTPNGSLDTRQPQLLLTGPVGVARDGTLHTVGTFTLPPGCHALAFVSDNNPNSISLIGSVTGVDWANFPNTTATSPIAFIFKVLEAIDPAITFEVAFANVGGSAKVWLAAVLDTMMVTSDAAQAGTVEVGVDDPSGLGHRVSPVIGLFGRNVETLFGVSEERAKPAPWQAPTAGADINFGNPGVGSSVILIPGSPSQSIFLHGMSWVWGSVDATLSGIFESSSGVPIRHDAAVSVNPNWHDAKGLQLPAGDSVRYRQTGGPLLNSVFCIGGAQYQIA